MEIEQFKQQIKKLRKKTIKSPSSLVNRVFSDLRFHIQPESYFLESPSEFVIATRIEAWNRFRKIEEEFNHKITKEL